MWVSAGDGGRTEGGREGRGERGKVERELACVDMKAIKARGHAGRKTLEVIHRNRMAHLHTYLFPSVTLKHS